MRPFLFILPFALIAAPAAAQQAPATPAAEIESIPSELADPRVADRLADAMQALSEAFLDLPVGEVEAAAEGRSPTPADKSKTVRSATGASEEQIRYQIEAARPAIRAGMEAFVKSLPAMMRAMAEASKEFEKVGANMPRPDYPKR